MEHAAYLRSRAERYFRLARAKSDRGMADDLETLVREFLARAENLQSERPPPALNPVPHTSPTFPRRLVSPRNEPWRA